jgi:hypothetical protein
MKALAVNAAVLSGLGALLFMGTVASTVPAAAKCMCSWEQSHRPFRRLPNA